MLGMPHRRVTPFTATDVLAVQLPSTTLTERTLGDTWPDREVMWLGTFGHLTSETAPGMAFLVDGVALDRLAYHQGTSATYRGTHGVFRQTRNIFPSSGVTAELDPSPGVSSGSMMTAFSVPGGFQVLYSAGASPGATTLDGLATYTMTVPSIPRDSYLAVSAYVANDGGDYRTAIHCFDYYETGATDRVVGVRRNSPASQYNCTAVNTRKLSISTANNGCIMMVSVIGKRV